MSTFQHYAHTGSVLMRPIGVTVTESHDEETGELVTTTAIEDVSAYQLPENHEPALGDLLAVNPDNHNQRWLVPASRASEWVLSGGRQVTVAD